MTFRLLRRLQVVLFVLAGFALAYVVYVFVDAERFQRSASQHLHSATIPFSPQQAQPPPQPPPDGTAFGRFEVPRLNVNVVVVQGDTDEDLRRGAGHIPGTSLPGAKGNVGIAAHRDTFFRPLRNIRRGDVIELKENYKT